MKFKYQDTEYDLVDPDKWTTLEAVQLQEASGHSPAHLVRDFRELGAEGLHALVWISLRRAGTDIAWSDLELPYFATLNDMSGAPVQEAADPSTASTRRSSNGRGGRRPSPSAKK